MARNFMQQPLLHVKDFAMLKSIHEQCLHKIKVFGVDIEFTPDIGYYGKISLIQLSLEQINLVIDTITITDSGLRDLLASIFEDQSVLKVFYGGHSDLVWLLQEYKITVKNYFDLQDAAELVNKHADNSLIGLWKRYFDFDFDKKFKKQLQTSEWDERPLTLPQISYAALDCHYLVPLYEIFKQKLSESDMQKLSEKFSRPIELKEKSLQQQQQQWSKYASQVFKSVSKEMLEEFPEREKDIQYISTIVNCQLLIKYIFVQLKTLLNEYTKWKDLPTHFFDEDRDLVFEAYEFYLEHQVEKASNYQPILEKEANKVASCQFESWESGKKEILKFYEEELQKEESVRQMLGEMENLDRNKTNSKKAEVIRRIIKRDRRSRGGRRRSRRR